MFIHFNVCIVPVKGLDFLHCRLPMKTSNLLNKTQLLTIVVIHILRTAQSSNEKQQTITTLGHEGQSIQKIDLMKKTKSYLCYRE